MGGKANEAEIEQWRTHIQAWQESGLSQAAYCQQHELVCSRFGYWRRKLAGESLPASGFVQVVRPQSTTVLSVRLPSGLEINGVDGNNVEVVTELLARLS